MSYDVLTTPLFLWVEVCGRPWHFTAKMSTFPVWFKKIRIVKIGFSVSNNRYYDGFLT